jgi:hypothetical protein
VTRGAVERGSAMVEFTFLGVLLMVPLAYAVLCVFVVQKAAYAATQATREAGRAYVTAPTPEHGAARAELAAALALRDHGLAPVAPRIACPVEGCLSPGGTHRFSMEIMVDLPGLPKVLDGAAPARVRVAASHDQVVDRFRDAP